MKKIVGLLLFIVCFSANAQLRVVPYVACEDQNGFFVSVKNVGPTPITIKKSNLPWLPSSTILKITARVRNEEGEFQTLASNGRIWDTFFDPKVTLAPDQIMSGFISFDLVLGNFSNERKRGDIFIGYRVNAEKFLPTHGVIVVPRARFWFADRCPGIILNFP